MTEATGDKIDALVASLLKRTDDQGQKVIKKYTREWLVEMLQGEMLEIIEKKFEGYQTKGLDVVDFVKVMLGIFEHAQSETIYIVLELIELFKAICESQGLKDVIRFKNFTDYIIQVGLG
jgi:transcriptional regulator